MTYDVKVLKSQADCRRVIERAIKAGDTDLERRALVRVAELGGGDYCDPLVAAFYSTLAVYEQTLPRGRANYLRRKLSNLGGGVDAVEQILRDWCTDKGLSSGFHHLLERGLKEHVGEYIVGVRFPERFPVEVVTAAREKLTEHGIVRHSEFGRRTENAA